MPLLAGDVSIDNQGVETKTGYAGELYDQLIVESNLVTADPLPTGPDGADGLRGIAVVANAIAKTIMPHLIANLEVRAVFTGGSDPAMQRDPAGSNDDCLGPVFDKTLFAKAAVT